MRKMRMRVRSACEKNCMRMPNACPPRAPQPNTPDKLLRHDAVHIRQRHPQEVGAAQLPQASAPQRSGLWPAGPKPGPLPLGPLPLGVGRRGRLGVPLCFGLGGVPGDRGGAGGVVVRRSSRAPAFREEGRPPFPETIKNQGEFSYSEGH